MSTVAASLVYRKEAIAYEVFPTLPRTGESVMVPNGSGQLRFRVQEVEWIITPGCAMDEVPRNVSAKLYVEHLCDRCYIPMSRERMQAELCGNCEEAKA
jgi:hypothetical protein